MAHHHLSSHHNLQTSQSAPMINMIDLFKYNHCTPFQQLMESLKKSRFDPSVQVCSLKDMGRDLLRSWNGVKRTFTPNGDCLKGSESLLEDTERLVMDLLDSAEMLQSVNML